MPTHRGFRSAYLRGMEAFLNDEPRADPYTDKRTHRGAVTWSRAFASAWRDGYDDAKRDRPQALITLQYTRRK